MACAWKHGPSYRLGLRMERLQPGLEGLSVVIFTLHQWLPSCIIPAWYLQQNQVNTALMKWLPLPALHSRQSA